jgi:hypothetical protein
MGLKCRWGTAKCRFGGTKLEQRFNCRRATNVSSRALQRLELLGHGIGPEVEMGSVPGRNAVAKDDGLG